MELLTIAQANSICESGLSIGVLYHIFPYRVKTTLVGYWQGWLYFTSGQRDKGPTDPAPKKVIGEMRTKLKLNS
ncbi:kelch repeat-containing protein isoform X1 [Gossypium australe]|uniref:Kelch repeat-containing protein isoform X1 n=1 Tax=Gossypium australe TaxID=47621 RepID=A0A5B6X5I5_9ROSI|nr:kelch repeat-containing protein isoform X1 [Gossypium australe]